MLLSAEYIRMLSCAVMACVKTVKYMFVKGTDRAVVVPRLESDSSAAH